MGGGCNCDCAEGLSQTLDQMHSFCQQELRGEACMLCSGPDVCQQCRCRCAVVPTVPLSLCRCANSAVVVVPLCQQCRCRCAVVPTVPLSLLSLCQRPHGTNS